MKIARFFALIFGVLGVVLMLGTALVCFASTDATVKLVKTPTAALECSETLAAAIDSGDLAAAGAVLYGSPDLGAGGGPSDEVSAMLWDAYLEGISCQLTSKLYLKDAAFARDLSVSTLDIASVTASVQVRAKALLEAKVAAATDMDELYDSENNFREDLIAQVLRQATEQALEQEASYITREATVKLIFQDGTWWAVPDQALLTALSVFGS